VRISFGIASNFADAHRFVEFARTFRDRRAGGQVVPETSARESGG
jgi:hypothetical protein